MWKDFLFDLWTFSIDLQREMVEWQARVAEDIYVRQLRSSLIP